MPFEIGTVNGREGRGSGLRLKAQKRPSGVCADSRRSLQRLIWLWEVGLTWALVSPKVSRKRRLRTPRKQSGRSPHIIARGRRQLHPLSAGIFFRCEMACGVI